MQRDDPQWPFAEAIYDEAGGLHDVPVDVRTLGCAQNLDDNSLNQTVLDLFAKGLLRKPEQDIFMVKLRPSGIGLVDAYRTSKGSDAAARPVDAESADPAEEISDSDKPGTEGTE